jgi:hypothetical protein
MDINRLRKLSGLNESTEAAAFTKSDSLKQVLAKLKSVITLKSKPRSTTWLNYDYDPAPKNQEVTVEFPESEADALTSYIAGNGWQKFYGGYAHPVLGKRLTIEIVGGRGDNVQLKMFKTNHKGSMDEY